MPGGRKNPNLVDQLALHVAAGKSIRSWALANNLSERTCYGWSAESGFKLQVAEHRRRINDQAVGRLTRHTTRAIGKIARLMDNATSEVVQLNAARTILSELVNLANHHEIEDRIAALEKIANEQSKKSR